jgi:hypothetical protein
VEPLKFGERGTVLDVTIEEKGAVPVIKQAPIQPVYAWEKEEIHITRANYEDVIERLQASQPHTIKQVLFQGTLSSAAYKTLEQALSLCEHNFFALLVENRTGIEPSEEEISELDSIGCLGEAVKTLINEQAIEQVRDDDVSVSSDTIKTAALDKVFQFLRTKEIL